MLFKATLLTICGHLQGRDAKLGSLQHVDVMPVLCQVAKGMVVDSGNAEGDI